jgi:copper chaperone CopZ
VLTNIEAKSKITGGKMKKTELNIKGMHCNSCVMLIKDALAEEKGVKDANVDLKKNKATISYDEKLTDEKKLIQIIEKEGYSVAK